MGFTRRQIAFGLAAATAAAPGLAFPLTGAAAETLPVDLIMTPGPLADIVIGAKGAPVTIVEYAALTCPHCEHFHSAIYPALAAKYIEPGKVRFIMREFVLNALDTAGWMLARYLGDDKRTALVDLLFDKQEVWVHDNPINDLFAVVSQAGFTQETFDRCLKDQQLYDAVVQTAKFAEEKLGVDSTPTFFINGTRVSGAEPIEEFDKIILPMLRT
jgi:protein-disulfide isomerase